jgi:hypothetical protein
MIACDIVFPLVSVSGFIIAEHWESGYHNSARTLVSPGNVTKAFWGLGACLKNWFGVPPSGGNARNPPSGRTPNAKRLSKQEVAESVPIACEIWH